MGKTSKPKNGRAQNVSHPVQYIYKLLAMLGTAKNASDIRAMYDDEGGHVSIAIPAIKFAIAFPGDAPQPLADKGWHIERLSFHDVEPFSRVFLAAENSVVASNYARADPNVKNTSKEEERIMAEIYRRMLPVPNRNRKFVRDDGTELTTPDFTWEDEGVAFFMDGAYWHSVKSDQAIVKEIKSSKKMRDSIVEKRKDKVRKDASIRSELGAQGWIVLACTDDDVATPKGVKEQVDLIEKALMRASMMRKVKDIDVSDESMELMDSLLESDDSDQPHTVDDTDNQDDDINSEEDADHEVDDSVDDGLKHVDKDELDTVEDSDGKGEPDSYDDESNDILSYLEVE